MDFRPILSTLLRHKTAAALIVLEIALSCAIVCNALFLINERAQAASRDSGIAESELLHINLGGIGTGTDADARTREDVAALRAIPGVTGATTTNQLPFSSNASTSGFSLAPGQERSSLEAATYQVGDDFVRTMGIRLVAGRDFHPGEYVQASDLARMTDFSKVSSVAIVSAEMAARMFPGETALGKTIYMGPIPLTIVGIAQALARPLPLDDGNMTHSIILPLRMSYADGGSYMIRVADPARRAEILKAAVATLERVDPNRLVLQEQTYSEIREDYFRADREMIVLLSVVCIALLVVTAFGIVGLASFWVQQRTKQIGIRRALGATRGQILRYFQLENFLLASIGIAFGMLLAFAINQLLMSKYELPRLPLAYLPIGAAVLWLLGQLAVLAPARRAAAVPPAIATRTA